MSKPEFEDLISQLPKPTLIAGDLNAFDALWSSQKENSRGRMIASVLEDNNLVVLNKGELTFFPQQLHYSPSSPDVTACSPELASKLDWTTAKDLHGSDHIPILLGSSTNTRQHKRRPGWKINLADWTKYDNEIEERVERHRSYRVEELTRAIVSAATASIPKTSESLRRRSVPWWNDRVAEATKKRRKSLRNLKRTSTDDPNYQRVHAEFREARNAARKVIKEEKTKSWQEYVSSINHETPLSEVWEKIRLISGKKASPGCWAVHTAAGVIVEPEGIAEHLGEFFESVSSDAAYESEFVRRKKKIEKFPVVFPKVREAAYLSDFSMNELLYQLDKLTGTSPGPDNVHNSMLQHLPFYVKKKLLDAFNLIWAGDDFPDIWRETLLIPIAKPGKNPNDPDNLRPIHLSSCVLKLFERMVNRRLVDELEERNIFGQHQAAFRCGRSTLDVLASIENFGKAAVAEKKHAELLLLDIAKAYDRTWRRLVLEGLANAGIGGRMAKFCSRFLEERRFRVCVQGQTSSLRKLANGVPQGSVLAVTFFLLAIGSIRDYIQPDTFIEMFADDITVGVTSSNVRHARQKLQSVVKQLEQWCSKTGFTISTSKTVAMHICHKRSHFRKQPALTLGRNKIQFVGSHKILGVWIDTRFALRRHIQAVRADGRKCVNLVKCLGKTSFGADRLTMLTVVRMMILPKLLYGAAIFSAAGEREYMKLAPLYHVAIRCATGAFRSSPIESILADTGLLPFDYLVKQETVLYATRQLEREVINRNYPLYKRALDIAEMLNIEIPRVAVSATRSALDWKHSQDTVRIQSFGEGSGSVQRAEFHSMVDQYYCYREHVYTDGSSSDSGVGCGVHSSAFDLRMKLSSTLSIFSAEAFAILRAVQEWKSRTTRAVIFSDSLSVVSAVEGCSLQHPWVVEIRRTLAASDGQMELCWIPAHVGIVGNERADTLAKEAVLLNEDPKNSCTPYPDFRRTVRQQLQNDWNEKWRCSTGKLRSIKHSTIQWRSSCMLPRRDGRVITRLRIGHTAATHGHLMSNSEAEPCLTCGVPVTVQHLLIDCRKFDNERQMTGVAASLYMALGDDMKELEKTINFLKETKLYAEI